MESLCGSLILVLTLLASAAATGQNFKAARAQKILNEILNDSYDPNIRPFGFNKSETDVIVNLMINWFSKIDDLDMEYKVQLNLRMNWYDGRLNYSKLDPNSTTEHLVLADMSRIWTPDLFFVNEKDANSHKLLKPNSFTRIYRSGEVQTSSRISLTLSCHMNLFMFPMDVQHCGIIMASYAWTTEDLNFIWREDDPVQMPHFNLPRFTLESVKTSTCERKTCTGIYPCIRVEFKLSRKFSFYITQVYLPCVMVVIVSWVGFWIDENAAPARTAIVISTLLTITSQQASVNKDLPPVPYIKALDIWTQACVVFVFTALLEYAFVNHAIRVHRRESISKTTLEASNPFCSRYMRIWRKSSNPRRIDIVSRFLFPSLFITFNLVYWTVLYLHY